MDTISAQSRDHLRKTIIDEIKSSEESIRALKSRIQVLKSRHNALVPISRLPPETLATIFTFLSASAWEEKDFNVEWICVARICRRWREAALNHPHIWSYIDFTGLTPAGMAGMLARAKMAPLYLKADVGTSPAQILAIERQLETHISHIRHLSLCGYFDFRLLSPPTLEFFSLSPMDELPRATIAGGLLYCTAPNVTSLELECCDISWKSPLLKGPSLRSLQILEISAEARPNLEDWLDALNEMPQLEELSLISATPLAPLSGPVISEPSRSATLPSLTRLYMFDSSKDCALALAHLVLPTLTRLHVEVESHDREGGDVRLLIPYIARNVHVLQDIKPIRSIKIAGKPACTKVYAWATPGADVEVCDLDTQRIVSHSERLLFEARGNKWRNGVETAIFDALLTLLPVNPVLTFTAQNHTQLGKEFWLSHAPRWPLLEQARLVPTSVGTFGEMLAEDTPPDGPRLPSLTRLILLDVTLTALWTYQLRDMLIKRVEQGIPLEVLDLRTCVAATRAIQLLAEIVIDVQEPLDAAPMAMEELFNWH